ncbi:MAG: ankyrin repeat domain-containing protein [Pseudomonadota bacterium]
MGKKKRTTLPKDFQEILERGDSQEILAVFDSCDVNARGGYGKQTAIAFDQCPDEVVRWLCENGADLSATNTWGRSALHIRSRSGRGDIRILLEVGANLTARDTYGDTPLHSAANSHNARSAKLLIEHGAKVEEKNNEGLTPLEVGLRSCRNIDIENTVDLARVFLAAGAQKSDSARKFVETIGQTFEFHREGFNKDSVDDVSRSLEQLYALFDVAPIPRKQQYDGKSSIIPTSATWQSQHEELWNLLVPSSGHANTVQGELIRVSGRIANEIEGNGGANWDSDFKKMAECFVQMLQQGEQLSIEEVAEAKNIVKSIKSSNVSSNRLAQLAVAWVKKNSSPILLKKTEYKR